MTASRLFEETVGRWTARDQHQPGGDAYLAALMRRGCREFQGGAVCWEPQERCEGVCRQCPLQPEGAS